MWHFAKVQSAIRSEEKRTGERVSLEMRAMMISKTENKTLRETERIITSQFPDAVKTPGVPIVVTEEQHKDLERVRELKSHSNFGASLGEIIAILAKDYLDRNDPLRREVKPRPSVKKFSVDQDEIVDVNVDLDVHVNVDQHSERTNHSCPSTPSNTSMKKHGVRQESVLIAAGTSCCEPSGTVVNGFGRSVLRKPIAPSIQNFVRRRAGDACEYESDSGHRCGTRFQTQVDHIFAGGTWWNK